MGNDRETLERLKKQFGNGWFTARMGKLSLPEALRLSKEGKLNSSKPRLGPPNFQVNDRYADQ